jgi:hypothetical protein
VTGRHRAAERSPHMPPLCEVLAAVSNPSTYRGAAFPDDGWRLAAGSTDVGCRVLPEPVLAQLLPAPGARTRHSGSTAPDPGLCATGAADPAMPPHARPRPGTGTTGEQP